MTIDSDKSFDVGPAGFGIKDSDGNFKVYITSSDGDPSGSPSPVNTWVFREDTTELYFKFGANDSDWSVMPKNLFIDKIYNQDLVIPVEKVSLLHEPCFDSGNLIIEGSVVIV